jgi:Trypsin
MRLPPSDEEGTVTRSSTTAVHHHNYDSVTLKNDIGLIVITTVAKYIDNGIKSIQRKLLTKAQIYSSADRIGLAKLPTTFNYNYTGLQCIVSGWGLNKSPLDGCNFCLISAKNGLL